MEEPSLHFVEVCIDEVKPDKTGQFEALLERAGTHHRRFLDVRYMKRTHRQGDFSAVRQGEPAIRLTLGERLFFPPPSPGGRRGRGIRGKFRQRDAYVDPSP